LDCTGNNLVTIPDCSCEGLAQWALDNGQVIIQAITNKRAFIERVTVFEDSKNSATATCEGRGGFMGGNR
jgi:hypothetical protein